MPSQYQGQGYAVAPEIPDAYIESPHEPLGLLYQGLLASVVRLKTARQHITDCGSFRKRTKATLDEVERVALSGGYDGADIKDTRVAVVAFLDEVVLNSPDPVRLEWERGTLQEELFGQNDAGVVFFEKLAQMQTRRNSQKLADVLEVFLVCLLLGFQGRYSGLTGELQSIANTVEKRIEDIRGRGRELSPHGLPGEEPPAQRPLPEQTTNPALFRNVALSLLTLTVLLFFIFYWNLSMRSSDVFSSLRYKG